MDRREFLGLTAGAIAAGALSACASRGVSQQRSSEAELFHRARRHAITRYGRIAWVEQGRGPAALFIHGFPLNGFQWRGALARLAPLRRCVAPDLMGLGYSIIAATQPVTPDAQVDMLVSFLDALSIRSVDLIANDSGGAVAQLFLARHADRVRTLLLTNCDVENDSPPPSFLPVIAAAKAHAFADKAIAPALADKARTRSPEGLGGLAYTDPEHLTDEVIECYFSPLVSSELRKRKLEEYAIALEHNPLAGIEPSLRRCEVPVRIVWGTGDTVFSQASPDYLDRVFPHSRGVRRVPGAKLFFPEEYPDVIAEEARRLWEEA